ncbi:MAG TPA: hypothetical protein VIY90_10100 [Steroidobacteraceae bacterium]
MRNVIVVLALLLAGCVHPSVQPDNEFGRFKGQDIDVLINRLGDPLSQQIGTGATVYVWRASKPVQSIPTTPVIVSQGGGSAVGVTAPPPVVRNMQLSCTLTADTDPSGKILQLRRSGNRDACADYVQALAP